MLVVVTQSPKKRRNREYKVCLNRDTIVHLLDAIIVCNIDKSIINFLIPLTRTSQVNSDKRIEF